MKKRKLFFRIFLILLSLLTAFSADASPYIAALQEDAAVLTCSDALAVDFEGGTDVCWSYANGTASYTSEDTFAGSGGALWFSTQKDFGSVGFPLRGAPGNTYSISAMVKVDEMPSSQAAYFIVYNKSADGEYRAWNTLNVTHTENFEPGKWVLCSASYTPTGKGVVYINGVRTMVDVEETGDIEFRLGSGKPSEVMNGTISYTIDDFFVFPDVDNRGNTSGMILNSGMQTEAEYAQTWMPSGSAAKIVRLQEGANGTVGSAEVEVLGDWGALRTVDTVAMEFGRKYILSFYAKATCDEAVGLDMYAYLMYNSHKTNEQTPKWVITKPSSEPKKLTEEWQRFSILFAPSSQTPEKIYPYIYFRAGEGTERVSYAIDEVSVVQSGDSNFSISANCMGVIGSDELFLNMAFSESSSGYFVYRIKDDKGTLIKAAKTEKSSVEIMPDMLPSGGDVCIEAIGVDAYGLCSRPVVCRSVGKGPVGDSISLKADQFIWTPDSAVVSATVSYDRSTSGAKVCLVGAQYSPEGKLLAADIETRDAPSDEQSQWQVLLPVHKSADRAKFFAWYSDSLAPVSVVQLDKTTEGEFIYLDAASDASVEDGSFASPYRTLDKARAALREKIAHSDEKDIYLIFKSGEYIQPGYGTAELTPAEYSTDKNVIFTSLEGKKAAFSGGMHISGAEFDLWDDEKNIYRAPVAEGTASRQLYVNGIRATRARSGEDAVFFRNLDWEQYKSQGSAYVFSNLGLISPDTSFAEYRYPAELELNFIESWRHQSVMVDTITASVDEHGNAVSHFGFTDSGNKSMWKTLVTLNTNATIPVFVENAYELLDEPGEWYLDTHENYIYYMPRSFEDIAGADFVLPVQTKLLTLKGTPDAHAKNVSFRNIDFTYTTWNYPTEKRSFRNNQNAFYSNPEGGQLMPGAVEIYDATGISFDNCDFSHIGSMGLKMTGAIQHSSVTGNEFYDIAGTALALGDVAHADAAHKNQIINPTDSRFYITDNLIANNYIHRIATDYYSAAAISIGFPMNTTIRNNEITDCPYSGMHIGYGWASYAATGTATKNLVVEKNYIHDVLNWRVYDGGGVYSLGATGGTGDNMNQIRRNYFEDIKNSYAALYPDEGSTYWEISENVINQQNYPVFNFKDSSRISAATWLHIHTGSIQHIRAHSNYSTTPAYRENGTYNEVEVPVAGSSGNWPAEAEAIIAEAGIEQAYRSRFDFDLQSLRMQKLIMVEKGKTVRFACEAAFSKDMLADTSDFEVSFKSSDTSIATVDDNSVTGVSPGNAWITASVLRREDGRVTYYDEFSFCVKVE